jgi:hypothetical protein
MKILALFVASVLLLAACSSAAPSADVVETAIAETQTGWTPVPSQTPYPTHTPYPTQTALVVVQTKIVTATYSGPTETFTPTATLAPSATPKPTVDITKADRGDGSYLVGTEIAAGIWRSSGGSPNDECWLTIKTLSGDLVDITGQLPGATIRILSGQYIVYIGGGSGNMCTWSFLMP